MWSMYIEIIMHFSDFILIQNLQFIYNIFRTLKKNLTGIIKTSSFINLNLRFAVFKVSIMGLLAEM